MDRATCVCEQHTETLGQSAGAALRPGELFLASAGDAREPRRFTSAGRADDVSARIVEGEDLDVITPGAEFGVPAES
ncbi:hypothetical protein GCM10009626_39600 [Brachybacterium sacelli]